MKYLYTLVLVAFLASCANPGVEQENGENTQTGSEINTETETNQDIENEMDSTFDESNEDNEVERVEATYNNPATEVDMVVEYTLDEDDFIQSINASATTFDVSDFNEWIQYLVGQPIEEAEEVYVSGSSLSSEAFADAVKNR